MFGAPLRRVRHAGQQRQRVGRLSRNGDLLLREDHLRQRCRVQVLRQRLDQKRSREQKVGVDFPDQQLDVRAADLSRQDIAADPDPDRLRGFKQAGFQLDIGRVLPCPDRGKDREDVCKIQRVHSGPQGSQPGGIGRTGFWLGGHRAHLFPRVVEGSIAHPKKKSHRFFRKSLGVRKNLRLWKRISGRWGTSRSA